MNDWSLKAAIHHGGDRASYHKVADCVRMPNTTAFDGMEEYYSTLFHELTHATGQPSPMHSANRCSMHASDDGVNGFLGRRTLCGSIRRDRKLLGPLRGLNDRKRPVEELKM